MSDPRSLPRLMEILDATAPRGVPPSDTVASVQPDVVCADCSALLGWREIGLDPLRLDLVCAPCQAARQGEAAKRSRWRAVVAQPFTWVGVAVFIATVLYLFGAGNPSVKALAADDVGRPWFRQELPQAWLAQAERLTARLNGNSPAWTVDADRRPWFELKQRAMLQALAAWRDTPVGPDLILAAALAEARSGDKDSAYRTVLSIGSKFPADDPRRQSYLYHRGVLRLELGKTDLGREDLETVLRAVASVDFGDPQARLGRTLDPMLEAQNTADQSASAMTRRVQTACETRLADNDLRDRILDCFAHYRIDSAVARQVRRPVAGMPGGMPSPLLEMLHPDINIDRSGAPRGDDGGDDFIIEHH